jgi:hypothetical protein
MVETQLSAAGSNVETRDVIAVRAICSGVCLFTRQMNIVKPFFSLGSAWAVGGDGAETPAND